MLFDDTFKTIKGTSSGLYKEKGSKFIGLAFPIRSEEEVKNILNSQKKEHPQANHHCYAFRLGPDKTHFRFSDDREPSGTAGKPILNQLMAADLTNTLIIVVRYFGGSLLGVPGLINAYKAAAKDAISKATIIESFLTENYRVTFDFADMNEVICHLKNFHAKITRQEFAKDHIIDYEIRKSKADELSAILKKIYKSGKNPEIIPLLKAS